MPHGPQVDKKELSQIRHLLGKTQGELAYLLCVSPKAIQSFEQGWRKISVSAERQLILLLSLKRLLDDNTRPCWEILNCPTEWREKCTVWELKAGYFCWFINGTYCQGQMQGNWERKIKLCRQCEFFQLMVPKII